MKAMKNVIRTMLAMILALTVAFSTVTIAEEVAVAETVVTEAPAPVVEIPAPVAEAAPIQTPAVEEAPETTEAPEATEIPEATEATETPEIIAEEKISENENNEQEIQQDASNGSEEAVEENALVEIEDEMVPLAAARSVEIKVKGNVTQINYGDELTLVAELKGYEGTAYSLQWQEKAPNADDWSDIKGETDKEYTFRVTEENEAYAWRVIVTIAD